MGRKKVSEPSDFLNGLIKAASLFPRENPGEVRTRFVDQMMPILRMAGPRYQEIWDKQRGKTDDEFYKNIYSQFEEHSKFVKWFEDQVKKFVTRNLWDMAFL